MSWSFSRRVTTRLALAVSAISSAAWAATPSVLCDVRVHDTGGKTATVTEIGQEVVLDLYITASGSNANPNDDRIQTGSAYLLSSTGGLKGDLLADYPASPFGQSGAATGVQVDRDSDGDLDVGSPTVDNSFFAFRATPVPPTQPSGGFFLGSVHFIPRTVTADTTQVRFDLRSLLVFPDGGTTPFLYFQPDGTSGVNVTYGTPVIITGDPAPVSGDVTYLSGSKPVHVKIDSHMSAAANGALTFLRGLDVVPGGTLDPAAGATIALNVNDLTSGNAGGTLLLNTTTIADSDNGTFIQSGGFTRLGQTQIGYHGNGEARLVMTGGTLEATSVLVDGGGLPASIAQSGGSSTLSSLDLHDGASATLSGTGSMRVIGDAHVGNGGNATFSQAGGTAQCNNLYVGEGSLSAAGNGTYLMQGGNLTAANTWVVNLFTSNAVGHYQQSGGTSFLGALTVTSPTGNPSTVDISGNANAEAIFLNLAGKLTVSGGKLTVDQGALLYSQTAGLTQANITGGTFTAGNAKLGNQEISGSHVTNYPGVMVQSGGAVDIGDFALRPNGLYQISAGTVRFGRSVSNSFSYESGGGTIDFTHAPITVTFGNNCFADFSQIQVLNADHATFVGGPGSLLNFRYDMTGQLGSIQTQGLVHINGQPLVIPAGKQVGGSGKIEGNVTNNGTVAPGNSPGILNVSGDYAQASTATLAMEIAGTSNDQFDQLNITGSAVMAGTLNVSLLNGFVPQASDQFAIVTAATLSGLFTNAPDHVDLAGGRFDVLYSPTSVTLTNFQAVPEPAAGVMLLAGAGLLLRRRHRMD